MISLLLIDDHPLVQVALEAELARSALSFALNCVDSSHGAKQWLQDQQPALVILDIGLPDGNGLELLKYIRRHHAAPVIIYSAQEERSWIRLAHESGAAGYIVKRQPLAKLVSAILAVLAGETVFPPETATNARSSPLTSKEQQILALLASGLSNLQIAERLHISNKTVSTHKKNIMEKTGASSLLSLAALWRAQQ
ncbi:DNA-binding response regulator [Izhakiella australiensis]|uniref:DNA-binding response regulator n=1 Tax=Izhakiella australiensis TaxID=1926881 RepID=A0A1S8YJ23_9GAMM|nr:response regulator transcription factor [Izhakiella australiensis]OON38895.1 DNA-binding response regulator [Izhakiella australiensis]